MTTYIEILDTAVKIGLGATISFFATYSLTKLNHDKALASSKREERKQLIREIALKLETADSKLNEAVHSINNEKKSDSRDRFVEAVCIFDEMKALSNLIGNDDIFELSEKIIKNISDSYSELNLPDLTMEKMKNYMEDINESKAKIYPLIRSEYNEYV